MLIYQGEEKINKENVGLKLSTTKNGFCGQGGLQECKGACFEVGRGRQQFLVGLYQCFLRVALGLPVACPGPYPMSGPPRLKSSKGMLEVIMALNQLLKSLNFTSIFPWMTQWEVHVYTMTSCGTINIYIQILKLLLKRHVSILSQARVTTLLKIIIP